MSGKPVYEIWCDGSYRSSKHVKGGRIAGGFVMRETASGSEYSHSRLFNSLSNSRKHGSMIAEIRAITAALCEAPKSEHIQIYNDNKGVIKALQDRSLSDTTLEKAGHDMHVAFRQAMLAIQRHDHVSFEQRGRNTKMMKQAHNLASGVTQPPEAKAA